MESLAPKKFKFFGFQPGISLRKSAEGVLGGAVSEGEPLGPSSAYVRKIGEGQFTGKLRVSIEGGVIEVHAQASSPRRVLKTLDARMHRKLGVGTQLDVSESDELTPEQ